MVQAEQDANARIESEYGQLLEQKEHELQQERQLRLEAEVALDQVR